MIRIKNLTGRQYPKLEAFLRTADYETVREFMNLANGVEEVATSAERRGRRKGMMGMR